MKSMHLLLVEDNEGDILLTTEALEASKVLNEVSIVRNGKLALDFVFKKNGYEDVKSPDVILMDINLPLKSGIEVLEILKSDESTKHIPIIILTTSSSESDIMKSYNNHANAYIVKPVDVSEFLEAVLSLEDFWLNIVHLPVNIDNDKR
ncbi:response regulator [Flavobacterium sp.]|jgi:CheY-like chemotaxis protein|uniref:response regulator n=1 Tax=Flavobacterium sp. TaxID=239 RepID=UPI000EC380FD|nr:response regulator [Flavobacterium sp.]HCQ12930.1 response regulator [Flavobacterium sp.]